MYQIGWFSTARGPGSRALLKAAWEAFHGGSIPARLAFVFCTRERGESEETDRFLAQVEEYQVPLVTLSFSHFRRQQGGRGSGFDGKSFAPWRETYDREVLGQLEGYRPDLVVLAGYMLVMTPALCGRFTTINLHPAAPGGPIGTWQQVTWQLIEDQATYSGVRIHLVTPDLDQGPIVSYCTYPLRGGLWDSLWAERGNSSAQELRTRYDEALPLFGQMREAGLQRELPLLLATVRAFSQGDLRAGNGLLVDHLGRPARPRDLTEEVEREVRAGLSAPESPGV